MAGIQIPVYWKDRHLSMPALRDLIQNTMIAPMSSQNTYWQISYINDKAQYFSVWSLKVLGVKLDNNLTYKEHIGKI